MYDACVYIYICMYVCEWCVHGCMYIFEKVGKQTVIGVLGAAGERNRSLTVHICMTTCIYLLGDDSYCTYTIFQ